MPKARSCQQRPTRPRQRLSSRRTVTVFIFYLCTKQQQQQRARKWLDHCSL